jgi:nitroreductase
MSTQERGIASGAERAFPFWAGPAERLRFLLQWAILAPSRHNAQPWIFEIEGDELRVYADASRTLPVADPDGRQLVMSCGAAIVNLRLAAQHFGHATTAEILRSHRRDGLLARVRLEERRATTPEAEEMFQAIPRRRTNRLPLDGREPSEGFVTALLREARREGAWLRPVEESERRAVGELVAEGDRLQWSSSRFRAELARWSRHNGTLRRDGMPGYALGMSDAAALVQPLLMRFTNPGREEADRDRRRATCCKALLVLSTPRDGTAEWIAAGEALQRILLRAAAAGLYASYFAQPIENQDLRRRLGDVLAHPGVPQVMFRLGYGLDVRPVPRRPVDEVLRRMEVEGRPRAEALVLRTPAPRWQPADGGQPAAP